MLSPGDVLEHRYEVLNLLGEGAMAQVWRVRHLGLHSEHALKVLRPEMAALDGLRDRFLAEGQIQSQLRHPNIVAVSDVVTDPLPGLVMDLVEGPTLAAVLATEGRLSPAEAGALLLPILDAGGLAHAAGVIHRDLKPENILLCPDPRRGRRGMVTDFGVARILEDAALRTDRLPTMMPMRTGTPGYMSPEQIRGEGVDGRSDLFALGALLYEMLTGTRAFAPTEGFDAERALAEGRYAPAASLTSLDPALAACVARALAPDPAARFPTCVAFSEALRAVPSLRPPTAPPTPAPPTPAPPTAVLIPVKATKPPQPAPPRPPPRPRRDGTSPWIAGALNLVCVLGLGQIANGQVGKGVLVFLVHAALAVWSGGLTWPVTWLLATVDAFLVAERRRQGRPAGPWGWF